VKPKCCVCQKFHFGLYRYKGKAKCSKCNHFGHNAKDCNNYKQLANYAQKKDVSTGTMFDACHAASVKEEDVWFVVSMHNSCPTTIYCSFISFLFLQMN